MAERVFTSFSERVLELLDKGERIFAPLKPRKYKRVSIDGNHPLTRDAEIPGGKQSHSTSHITTISKR